MCNLFRELGFYKKYAPENKLKKYITPIIFKNAPYSTNHTSFKRVRSYVRHDNQNKIRFHKIIRGNTSGVNGVSCRQFKSRVLGKTKNL